jgi:hypothetical protein
MACPKDTHVVKITRLKKDFTVLTTSSYCEIIRDDHEGAAMSYVIKSGKISQKCPVCKRPPKGSVRVHELSGSVKQALKPPKKK